MMPGTLCIVINIPSNMPGYEQNGMVCTVLSYEGQLTQTDLPQTPSLTPGIYRGYICTQNLLPLGLPMEEIKKEEIIKVPTFV